MPILLASFDEDRARQEKPQPSVKPAPVSDCNTACSQSETRQPMALAMAYVPWQRWQETYPLEEGFHRGTIFPELDLPFEGKRRGGMRK
jgi:hypothetical protein